MLRLVIAIEEGGVIFVGGTSDMSCRVTQPEIHKVKRAATVKYETGVRVCMCNAQ